MRPPPWRGRPLSNLTIDELEELIAELTARLPEDDPLLDAARRQIRRRRGLPDTDGPR